MSSWLHGLLGLHGSLAYLLVGALCLGEAALLLGFVIPGETAVVLGGVLASTGHVDLAGIVVVVVACAIAGDTIGYEGGRRLGPALLARRPFKGNRAVARATAYLGERGGPAVFLGRWTAVFRAVMPGVAGMAHLRYRTFLVYNALGGLLWGVTYVLLGYFAGRSYAHVASAAGTASTVLLVVVVVAVVVFVVWRRVRERRQLAAGDDGPMAAVDRPGNPD